MTSNHNITHSTENTSTLTSLPPTSDPSCTYPRVLITFCTKCKWHFRATWYLQELLSTFSDQLGEIALAPGPSGVFTIQLWTQKNSDSILIWDRKSMGGFPDSKELKRLIRNQCWPDQNLGHVDRIKAVEGLVSSTETPVIQDHNEDKGSPTHSHNDSHNDHQNESSKIVCEDCQEI